VDRRALQPENPIIQSHADRPQQLDLRAAADVGAEVRFLQRAERFAVAFSAGSCIELRAHYFDRRLHQHVAGVGPESGELLQGVLRQGRVLELEPDHEQSHAYAKTFHCMVVRGRRHAQKCRDVGARRQRGCGNKYQRECKNRRY
jgi:hypothetical protein